MDNAAKRREQLKELFLTVRECRRCTLAETRTKVVFGAGNADASIMFVGEAPGYHEDQQGLPFVGQAGKLLEKLLARIGLVRDDVFIANVLKCRPPGNRDPQPEEIALCREYLEQQIDLIAPQVVCTMGNFSTKLLSGSTSGITRVRGLIQEYPGKDGVSLFPVFHPAAALHMPANLTTLEKDIDRLGNVIGVQPAMSHDPGDAAVPRAASTGEAPAAGSGIISQVLPEGHHMESQPRVEVNQGQEEPEQLGLF